MYASPPPPWVFNSLDNLNFFSFFQRKNSVLKFLWECPESFATNYGEARPIFLIGKMSAERILASAETKDNDPMIFRVRLEISQLYKMLIYFEGRVLKPSTSERIGKLNKRRLDVLTQITKFDLKKKDKVLVLQVANVKYDKSLNVIIFSLKSQNPKTKLQNTIHIQNPVRQSKS